MLMQYRVEELAVAARASVDTIRFYQGRGLLPAPERRGRIAFYGDAHLKGLRRIRELSRAGFTLAQIRRLFAREGGPRPGRRPRSAPRAPVEPLLAALVEEGVGARTLTRAELAAESGLPEALLAAAQAGGLLEPVRVDGEERFTEADLEMCRAALAILGAGFPLHELLPLAVDHARGVQAVADRAIDLFDDHVRKRRAGEADGDAISEIFQRLLPQAARLVALHFQRTLVNRAMERLRASGDRDTLEAALAATRSARLEVVWR
jgi:DNA-binding transcriptional MerR regulator